MCVIVLVLSASVPVGNLRSTASSSWAEDSSQLAVC